MNIRIKRISILLIGIGLLAWFVFTGHEYGLTSLLIHYGILPPPLVLHSSSIYATPAFDMLVDQSDIVFAGRVVNISPTIWNQDSGERWVDGGAFEYHTLQFEMSQYVVDRIGMRVGTSGEAATIEIVVLEPSPLDSGAKYGYGLSVGDTAVVFARKTNIFWRSGEKQVLEIMSAPTYSIFPQGDDGNFKGIVVHNLGAGNFTTFATDEGQALNLSGMTEAYPANEGMGDFIDEEISISLPDFITQIQAADHNKPIPQPLPLEQVP